MGNRLRVQWGRATYPDDSLLMAYVGPCSHHTAYQARVASYGYFLSVIYRHAPPPPAEDQFRGDVWL